MDQIQEINNTTLRKAKFIQNRLGDICKVQATNYKRTPTEEHSIEKVCVNLSGKFLLNGEHGYDIVKILTKETNPEFFL